jgi:hypothetical protein
LWGWRHGNNLHNTEKDLGGREVEGVTTAKDRELGTGFLDLVNA